jgi:hypothetical protein
MMSKERFLGCHLSIQRRFRTGLLVALLCAAGFQTAGAATLTLVPGNSSVSVGDQVSVDIQISGLGLNTAPSLGTYDITIDIPSIFTFDNVAFGDPSLGDELGPTVLTKSIPGSNSIDLLEVSLDSVAALNTQQPDAFKLAVLNFTANSAGSGNFSIGSATLGDASAAPLSYNVSDATIGVVGSNSSVPEPSALLPLCGLLALIALMRKRLFAGARS